MNNTDFTALVNRTVDELWDLLNVKGGEYAGSVDRLANFKRGAALTGTTPLQCALIYFAKHYDALATYIRDEASGVARPRSEPIDGRIADLMNYCLLIKALIHESDPHRTPSDVVRAVRQEPATTLSWDDEDES